MKKLRHLVKITTIIVLFAAIFSAGYLLGHGNLALEKHFKIRLTNKTLFQPREVDFSLFWRVYDKVDSQYLEPLDAQKALYSAIAGLVRATGDPYSAFLDPQATKLLDEDLAGEFEGIGAEIGIHKGILTVIAPLEGSPAEKAGLRSKDQVLAINDEITMEMGLDEAISKIRGKAGTEVTLTILRGGEDKPREIKIVRAKIEVEDVEWQMDGEIAVVKIRQFGEKSEISAQDIAGEIKNKGAKGIILDLRDNTGGLLSAAVKWSGLLLPEETPVVIERSRGDKQETQKAKGPAILEGLPLVVLVNGGSASASEIVSGAVKDAGRGKIIGEETFGKGSVQTLEYLDGGTALKLTVSKWLTPKGTTIEENGIEPDETVELTDDDFEADRDPQMDRAKEVLRAALYK